MAPEVREVSMSKARDLLPAMVASFEKGSGYYVLTKRGQRIGAFIPIDMLEAMEETCEVLQDEELVSRLVKSIQQMLRGETKPLSNLKEKYELD